MQDWSQPSFSVLLFVFFWLLIPIQHTPTPKRGPYPTPPAQQQIREVCVFVFFG